MVRGVMAKVVGRGNCRNPADSDVCLVLLHERMGVVANMKCDSCESDAEIIKNGDDYEMWCDCGYHKVLTDDKEETL